MAIQLSKPEIETIVPSLRKYFKEELELDLSEMRAKFVLDYFLKEIAPFAYNKGVKDAESFFRAKIVPIPARERCQSSAWLCRPLPLAS